MSAAAVPFIVRLLPPGRAFWRAVAFLPSGPSKPVYEFTA